MTDRSDGSAQTGSDDSAALEERAREYILRALTASAKTRQQLAKRLADRDIPPATAEKLLNRFVEVGLIDDGAYAMSLARTRYTERGLSRRAIAAELRRKGLDQHHIDPALDQIDQDDEETAARQLVRGRLPRLARLAPDVQYRRLAGFLGRKGYSSGLANRVIKEESALLYTASDDEGGL